MIRNSIEFGPGHDVMVVVFVWIQDAQTFRNGLRGFSVITGNHDGPHAGPFGYGNGIRSFLTLRVNHPDQTSKD